MSRPLADVERISALALPAWLTDVQIEIGSTPMELNGATARGVLWQAAPGRFLLDVPEVARYFVEGGSRIIIEPAPDASETQVIRFLRTTPLAAVLYQRGSLAVHAAAIVNTNGAILLAGDSGAGKSTLSAALLQRGWHYSADELAAVELNEREQPIVLPAFPDIVLWQNSIERLNFQLFGTAPPAEISVNRHVVSVLDQFTAEPKLLHAICWLTVRNTDRLETRELIGTERFQALGTLSYNSHIADALFDRTAYFRQASTIIRSIPIYRIERPRGQWSVDDLADFVEQV